MRIVKRWYEMAEENIGGKFVRVYIVRCCRCEATNTKRAGSWTDENLRKKLVNEGWDIGSNHHRHFCPDHAGRRSKTAAHSPEPWRDFTPEPEPEPVPVPVAPATNGHAPEMSLLQKAMTYPRVSLEQAWDAATEEEREAFLAKHVPVEMMVHAAAAEQIEQMLGAPPSEPAPPSMEDDDAADWWSELQRAPKPAESEGASAPRPRATRSAT